MPEDINKDNDPGKDKDQKPSENQGKDKETPPSDQGEDKGKEQDQDLETKYKDARIGLSKQGEEIKELKQTIETVKPVLQTIYGDPELYQALVKKMEDKEKPDKKEDTPQKDPRVDQVIARQEAEFIKDFESETGISQMEDKEKVREEIGAIVKSWIPAGTQPSLSQLDKYFNDAWELYKARNNINQEEEEESSGFGTPRAAVGNVSKATVKSLSPEQLKAAEKMGLTSEQYLKELKEIVGS